MPVWGKRLFKLFTKTIRKGPEFSTLQAAVNYAERYLERGQEFHVHDDRGHSWQGFAGHEGLFPNTVRQTVVRRRQA